MSITSQKNILITGATGFIGKYFVEHAIKSNYKVYITLRKSSNTSRINHLKFNKVVVDFSSEDSINKSFSNNITFDTVIHNAGVKACFKTEDYYKYNVELTRNLCNVLKKRNLIKGKFVYVGSLAALGPGNSETLEDITEDKLPNPISNYGKSKLEAERVVLNSGLNYVIIRPTAVFGEGTSDYKDLIAIVKKKMAVYTANPNQQLSFVHADDIASAVFLAIDNQNNNLIYNLSDGKEYTLSSVYQEVADTLDIDIKIKFKIPKLAVFTVAKLNHFLEKTFKVENSLNSKEKAQEVTALNWKCTAKKIQQELNFRPKHSLKEIID